MKNKPEEKYFNRELSWLSFNHRVLQEASDVNNPLLERLKFLSIFSSNLDEFFRVRVAGLKSVLKLKKGKSDEYNFNVKKTLKEIYHRVDFLQEEFGKIFRENIIPGLNENNIFIKSYENLTEDEINHLKNYFNENLLFESNPIILKKNKSNVQLKNGVLYLAVRLTDKDSVSEKKNYTYALVEIPTSKYGRFYRLPSADNIRNFILTDDIYRINMDVIFPGFEINEICEIKLNRDADLYIDDEFSGDLVEKIKKNLKKRNTNLPCRFLYDKTASKSLVKYLSEALNLDNSEVYPGGAYHNFNDYFNFPVEDKHLKNPDLDLIPAVSLDKYGDIFTAIKKEDHLIFYPYQSFEYFLKFLKKSANDPFVKEIKITQYRFAKNSAIVDILKSALKFGKKVLLFSEVKARFDEELNLKYSEELKDAGAEIIYSLPGLKVHSKIASVTLLENDGEKKYVYISTGNFNENTSKIYTDIALFTSDNEVTEDTEKVFKILKKGTVTNNNTPETEINENLTSVSNDIQTETVEVKIKDLKNIEFNQLLVSGFNMRKSFIRLIESEIENAKSGKESFIIAKMNSLEDKKIINKLYQASQSGVKIKLIVRGICCLIPGIPRLSENIKVISIVDRFLEHSRVYIFYNDGNPLIYLSSADWMKRNLSRRIEIAVPVNQNNLRTYLIDVINLQLKDNVKARIINSTQDNSELNKSVAEDLRSQMAVSGYLKNIK